jgi:hypothetical protein
VVHSPLISSAIDQGRADLLEALSSISGLAPVECRDTNEGAETYVLFRYGSSNRELTRFVARLAPTIRAAVPGVDLYLVIVSGGGELLARLAVPSGETTRLATAVRAARAPIGGRA